MAGRVLVPGLGGVSWLVSVSFPFPPFGAPRRSWPVAAAVSFGRCGCSRLRPVSRRRRLAFSFRSGLRPRPACACRLARSRCACRPACQRARPAVCSGRWLVSQGCSPVARPPGVVAVAGSRSLPPKASALVVAVCRSLVASGRSLVVGCCVGADAAVLGCSAAPFGRGVPVARISCLCAFGPGGSGAGPASAVSAVEAFAAAGGSVAWWAGGAASVPLPARLAARTRAVVARASAGCVVFFGSPSSRGSLLAASSAVSRDLPVFAFPVGFPGSALSSLDAGLWVPVGGRGVWASAWVWVSAQAHVFN